MLSVRAFSRISTRNVCSSACNWMKPTNVGDDGKQKDFIESEAPPAMENPFYRTGRILKNDILSIKDKFPFVLLKRENENINIHKHRLRDDGKIEVEDEMTKQGYIFPHHVDVCVIGGGAIGSSIAYFLKEKVRSGLRVAVIEKDCTVSFLLGIYS